MNEHEFAELSAGHALGALSIDDEKAYRAALAAHPEWAGIVDLDRETAAILAEGVAPVAPPLELRSRLLRAISSPGEADQVLGAASVAADAEPDAADVADAADAAGLADVEDFADADDAASDELPLPTEIVQTVQRRNWTRGMFALVASMVLLVTLGWGVGAITETWRTPTAVVALEKIEAAPDAQSASAEFEGGDATVHWSPSLEMVVLVADGLPTIATDQTFELWYVRDETPIAAGTFSADAGASTALLTGEMKPGDTIAVTVEQAGGSPDGTPSDTTVLAVPTA